MKRGSTTKHPTRRCGSGSATRARARARSAALPRRLPEFRLNSIAAGSPHRARSSPPLLLAFIPLLLLLQNSRRSLLVDETLQEECDLARYFRRVPSVRSFDGHNKRVGSLSWNHYILTSGSRDCSIINHDARSYSKPVSRFCGHSDEVCSLRWSEGGRQIASGGNDNLVCVWESLNMRSSNYLHRFNDHNAAVRALAWCPHQSNVLASGDEAADRCIKIWNTREGKCTASIETSSQVCALEWNTHQKEILSAHGYDQN